MKKFAVLFLAGFLILALGATVYAQPKLEFRASGFIDVQSFYTMNVPPLYAPFPALWGKGQPTTGSSGAGAEPAIPGAAAVTNYTTYVASPFGGNHKAGALDKYVGYFDTRFMLRFDVAMGKELSGTVQFEMDASRWGNSAGQNAPGGTGDAGRWSADAVDTAIKFMYLDFGLPYFGIPVPMSVRLGVQPMGIRPWFLSASDGSGVSGQINIDPVGINPFYFKIAEGVDWIADDCDVWGLQVNAKVATFTVGGVWMYEHLGNYPVAGSNSFAAYANGANEASFHWGTLFADGKAGPIVLQFDVGMDWGKVKPPGTSFFVDNVKYRGYATRLKASFPWEKFDFGIVGMYASGSDANKTSKSGLPGTLTANGTETRKVNGWVVPVGSEQAPAAGATVQESVLFYGQDPGASGGAGWMVNVRGDQVGTGSWGGTWFAKLYGSYKATPWYKVTLQGLYIGDTTKHGNTVGTRVKNTFTGDLANDKTIGVELDWINQFQLWNNLTAKASFGYLIAGKAMQFYTGDPVSGNDKMRNPWAFRTQFLYTF